MDRLCVGLKKIDFFLLNFEAYDDNMPLFLFKIFILFIEVITKVVQKETWQRTDLGSARENYSIALV